MPTKQERFIGSLQATALKAGDSYSIHRRSALYARDEVVKAARRAAKLGHFYMSVTLTDVEHPDIPRFCQELEEALLDKGFLSPKVRKAKVIARWPWVRVHVGWFIQVPVQEAYPK